MANLGVLLFNDNVNHSYTMETSPTREESILHYLSFAQRDGNLLQGE
jgi:hypothetical protein